MNIHVLTTNMEMSHNIPEDTTIMSIATSGLSPPKILFMQLLIMVRVLVHLPYKLSLKVQTILLIHTDMSV